MIAGVATLIEIAEAETPIGRVLLLARGGALCGVGFGEDPERVRLGAIRRFGDVEWAPADDPAGALSALRRYLSGDLPALDEVPVDTGGTSFQQRVWRALRDIPAGQTRSYSQLACAIGVPKAVRAVGAANGANPVGIIVPCHRVIGADGRLVGYGGGLALKRWLLAHEGAVTAAERPRQQPLSFESA